MCVVLSRVRRLAAAVSAPVIMMCGYGKPTTKTHNHCSFYTKWLNMLNAGSVCVYYTQSGFVHICLKMNLELGDTHKTGLPDVHVEVNF